MRISTSLHRTLAQIPSLLLGIVFLTSALTKSVAWNDGLAGIASEYMLDYPNLPCLLTAVEALVGLVLILYPFHDKAQWSALLLCIGLVAYRLIAGRSSDFGGSFGPVRVSSEAFHRWVVAGMVTCFANVCLVGRTLQQFPSRSWLVSRIGIALVCGALVHMSMFGLQWGDVRVVVSRASASIETTQRANVPQHWLVIANHSEHPLRVVGISFGSNRYASERVPFSVPPGGRVSLPLLRAPNGESVFVFAVCGDRLDRICAAL